MTRLILVVLASLLSAPVVLGSLLAPATYVADRCTGDEVSGDLSGFSKDWAITLTASQRLTLSVRDYYRLRQPAVVAPVPTGPQVLLANGDVIRGAVSEADEQAVEVTSELLGQVRVPLEAVAAIVFAPIGDEEAAFRLIHTLTEVSTGADELWFRNGDRLQGTLLSIDQRAVHVQVGDDDVAVPRQRLLAVVTNRELVVAPVAEGLHAVAVLSDGTELHLRSLRLDGLEMRAEAAFGAGVKFAADRLAVLEIKGGCVVYLSELKPASYRHVPYVGRTRFVLARDRSIGGRRLRLRGKVFRHGIAMHSRSEVTYQLDRKYRTFRAWVGIDDETGGRGNAVAYVLVDGEERFRTEELTGASPPVRVEVDVRDAERLTLGVDYGEQGDVLDHVDWADALLLRNPPSD